MVVQPPPRRQSIPKPGIARMDVLATGQRPGAQSAGIAKNIAKSIVHW